MTTAPIQQRRHDAIALTGALWIACFVLCYALLATPISGDNTRLMNLTESYGALERVALWQRAMSWLPGGSADGAFVEWPKPLIVWTVRVAMVTMFAVHAMAFRATWRSRSGGALLWLIGPIGAQAIMLLMVPSNADVFFYAITGDMANEGFNPYTTPLYDVFEHPLYPYNHWVDMTSVYGPVWTLINQGTTAITGPDPTRAVLGFKIALGAVAILVAAGTYGAARLLRVPPARATAAMVLVAWQPNMFIEAAGQAHNDIVMVALALAAVTLTIAGGSRSTRGGIVLATLSAGVKYVSLPLLGLLALTRLDRRHEGARRIITSWAIDVAAFAAVLVAAFAPYWTDASILTEMLSEPGRLYTNPLWDGPAGAIRAIDLDAGLAFEDITRTVAQLLAVAAVVGVLFRFAITVWRTTNLDAVPPVWTQPLIAAWAAFIAVLAYVPVNVHAWYWIWPVVPIALLVTLDEQENVSSWSAHRWFTPWLVATAVLTLIYHTRIVHP